MKKIRSLLALLICGIIYFTLAAGSSSSSVNTSSDANGTTSQTKEISTYRLNEDIYITNSEGKYRVKFTNITETDDRNSYSDKQADRVVIIEYEYENMTDPEDLYISDYNFKLYDKDNNQLETYPIDIKYPGSVSTGRKATASAAFALNDSNNYIELEYYDNMFNDKADCKVILEW